MTFALNRTTDFKTGRLGVAWINEDGSITLAIDPFVALPINDGTGDWLFTLFPKGS